MNYIRYMAFIYSSYFHSK